MADDDTDGVSLGEVQVEAEALYAAIVPLLQNKIPAAVLIATGEILARQMAIASKGDMEAVTRIMDEWMEGFTHVLARLLREHNAFLRAHKEKKQ